MRVDSPVFCSGFAQGANIPVKLNLEGLDNSNMCVSPSFALRLYVSFLVGRGHLFLHVPCSRRACLVSPNLGIRSVSWLVRMTALAAAVPLVFAVCVGYVLAELPG